MNFGKPQPIRLVIADPYIPYTVSLDIFRRLLEAKTDYEVIGEASRVTQAVELVRQLKPDILLLNELFHHFVMEALRELSTPANATPVRVILYAAYIDKSWMVEALQLGARGFVLMNSPTEVLMKAIQTVMAGEYWMLSEPVSNLEEYLRTLVQSMHWEGPMRWEGRGRQKKFGLTAQEHRIVFQQLAAGYSDEEIADYFKISEEDLSSIFDKLGVSKSRIKLAFFAEKFKK